MRERPARGAQGAIGNMIEAESLQRSFGARRAVRGLSLSVRPGQILGLLGPNGAGKTTTLRMLAGVLAPDVGVARIGGHDVQRQALAARRVLGYLPEGAPLYAEMSVHALLMFVARVRGLRRAHLAQRYESVVQALELENLLAQTIGTLSKGQRRRVGLAQAILHDPPALILDEPTDGLDPNQQASVRELLRGLARERAIIVSTHLLEDVPQLCNRLALLVQGRLLADTTPAEFVARSRYRGAVSFTAPAAGPVRAALGLLPEVDTVEIDALSGRVTVLPKPGRELLPKVQTLLASYQVRPRELVLEAGRMDDVFRSMTETDAAEAMP